MENIRFRCRALSPTVNTIPKRPQENVVGHSGCRRVVVVNLVPLDQPLWLRFEQVQVGDRNA